MYEYHLKEVVRVIDGDTLEVVIDLGFNIFQKHKIRLDGVDTPEISTKDEIEKKYANEAKEFVEKWVHEQKEITIKTLKDDKYGRILANLYGNGGECLNNILIEQGYAWVYPAENKDFNILLEKRKA